MCAARGGRGAGTRVGMGHIWNVADKLAALRTLLSGQVFLHNSSPGWGDLGAEGGGGSLLVRGTPAELEMFFLAGMANGII